MGQVVENYLGMIADSLRDIARAQLDNCTSPSDVLSDISESLTAVAGQVENMTKALDSIDGHLVELIDRQVPHEQ
jgi:hypothetical protein